MGAAADSEQATQSPGPGVRTTVTLLLLFHCFALAVAVFSNVRPSQLAVRLRSVPGVRAYTQLANMDLDYSYSFHLSYFPIDDQGCDHVLELKTGEGDAERTAVLPAPGLGPQTRYRRYELLAASVARYADYEDLQDLLVQRLGAALLRDLNAADGTIACRSMWPAFMADVDRGEVQPPPPPAYEAQLIMRPGALPDLLRKQQASDLAPATSGPATSDR